MSLFSDPFNSHSESLGLSCVLTMGLMDRRQSWPSLVWWWPSVNLLASWLMVSLSLRGDNTARSSSHCQWRDLACNKRTLVVVSTF